MKIGILTFHRAHNYGAYLQSYALANAINSEIGCDVEIVDYNAPVSERFYIREIFRDKRLASVIYNWKKYKMFKKEVKKLPISSDKLISSDPGKVCQFLSHKYDLLVVGSDEIWRLDGMRGFPNAYWLPEVRGCIKASYAASARNDWNLLDDTTRKKMSALLKEFDFISVRDYTTKKMIDSAFAGEDKARIICDPTFAFSFQINKELGKQLLQKKFKIDPAKKCLGIMVNKASLAKQIVKDCGADMQIISLFYSYPGTRSCPELTPFEWIQVIAALDGLITTFYHAMCFAIKSDVPFVVIEQRSCASPEFSKSFDLLSRYEFEDAFVLGKDEQDVNKKIKQFIHLIMNTDIIVNYEKIRYGEKNSFQEFVNFTKEIPL